MNNWKFTEELTRFEIPHLFYGRRDSVPEIKAEFPDPEGLLETAYAALKRVHCGRLSVETAPAPELEGEAHRLVTDAGKCLIEAASTEGVRRGIYHLIRKLQNTPPEALPSKTELRIPWLERRIARCFFGPIKRPPMNRDELLDNVDYYPDAYLDRLASEGINALWLTVSFRDLCRTRFTPDAAPDREKRFAKLNQTIGKCARYGIKLYVFCNEPEAWRRIPDSRLGGPELFGNACFCPCSEEGTEYLRESVRRIFAGAPGLGGMIDIVLGEGLTTCLSACTEKLSPEDVCPHPCGISPAGIMRRNLTAMRDGMRMAAPDAEFIAWFYLPEALETPEWIGRIFEDGIPEGVVPQLNCESGCRVEQLGKIRVGGDYWQSVAEPAENFVRFTRKTPSPVSAKLQTGCSHEVATVPYVPVPGILYRKFRRLRELGVSRAMVCWYFGCAPGIMNLAVENLAFTDFQTCGEEEFLRNLAEPLWGRANAGAVAEIWKRFSKAYENYPVSNMFQYYGPVANGVAWPLWRERAELPLKPTWILTDEIQGDNLCECLENHSYPEALELLEKLSSEWRSAFGALAGLSADSEAARRDRFVAEALAIQFESAFAILRFYDFRNRGMTAEALRTAEAEFLRRKRMIELCSADSRLGFHPEAEGYLYSAESIGKVLDFPPALAREEPEAYSGGEIDCGNFSWGMTEKNGVLDLHVTCRGTFSPLDEFFIAFDDGGGSRPRLMHLACSGRVFRAPDDAECSVASPAQGIAEIRYRLPRKTSTRVNLVRLCGSYDDRTCWPKARDRRNPRLNLIFYTPANMGEIRI